MKIFINFTNLFSINKNVRKEGEREKKRERETEIINSLFYRIFKKIC